MPCKIVSRLSNTGLAVAGLTLGLGLTHSQPLSAQFSKYSPYGNYGGYGSYGGSRQQQYYDDGYQEKSYSNDRGDMVPFKRTGVPVLALVALDAQKISIYDANGKMIQQSPVSSGTEKAASRQLSTNSSKAPSSRARGAGARRLGAASSALPSPSSRSSPAMAANPARASASGSPAHQARSTGAAGPRPRR